MFNKRCKNCGKKVFRKFDFCPWCGNFLKDKKREDYGLLGENDEDFLERNIIPMNSIFEKVFSDLNKLFSESLKKDFPIENVQIRFSSFPREEVERDKSKAKEKKKIRRDFQNKNLPIVKAESKIKRLPEGLYYEISVPGVKSKEDIFINDIEEGIEIKAYSNDKCYIKTIPIKVKSYSYMIKDGKILFKIRN
ncbi:MAG: hypothetical protein QXG18_02690 [Candidatus Pacearchaeota archaeon]